jgi:hypothetical protein
MSYAHSDTGKVRYLNGCTHNRRFGERMGLHILLLCDQIHNSATVIVASMFPIKQLINFESREMNRQYTFLKITQMSV